MLNKTKQNVDRLDIIGKQTRTNERKKKVVNVSRDREKKTSTVEN